MEQLLEELTIPTNGEGFTNITSTINSWIRRSAFRTGIIIVATKHTSCSLIINENADPRVLKDLSKYMKSLVLEEGLAKLGTLGIHEPYEHSEEGPDDMPAHIRTALTSSSLSLSIDNSALALGTWQAVYLWEHRHLKQIRKLSLHAVGEK